LHFRICQKTKKEGSNGLAFEFGILGKLAFGGGDLAKMPNFSWLGKRRIRGFLEAATYSRAVGLFFAPQIGCHGPFGSPDRAAALHRPLPRRRQTDRFDRRHELKAARRPSHADLCPFKAILLPSFIGLCTDGQLRASQH